ncbi:MAG: hypothetical protein NT113_18040 [Hyphomicrobiales bacterium]|nr:hypothetical protein [Hyphomicrobiales bacterium]
MDRIAVPLVNVFFAYELNYVPRGYRKVRTRWCPGIATVALRSVSKSVVEPAFRIERAHEKGRSITEVFRLDGALWWPIVFRPPFGNSQFFLNALENGIPAALEAISIDVLWAGKAINDFDPFFVGRIVASTEAKMRAMVGKAAGNLILVDEDQLFIRGGEPIYVAPAGVQPPNLLSMEVVNSGIGFGSALPLDPLFPANQGASTTRDIIAAAIEGRTYGISSELDLDQACHVQTFGDRQVNFNPIDFQIKACLRELSNRIKQTLDRPQFPQEILQSAAIFTDLKEYIDHPTSECAAALRVFLNWYRHLPLKQGYKFRAAYDLVRTCITAIEVRCRRDGLVSPFEAWRLTPAEEEDLALLAQ